MSHAYLTKKPPAELIISWPDQSESRYVRSLDDPAVDSQRAATTPDLEDEDYRVVTECAPYTASFNHLLSENRPNENPRRFVSLVYERMRVDAVPMNTETYNLLMARLVRFTDGSIFELYEQLKAEGTKASSSVQPNRETFVLLFRACERNAEYHRAFLLYQQMRDLFQLTPDTATYNTLLGFCAAVKDVAQAGYFVDEMRTQGVPMDANTYNCYMSVLVDAAPYTETLAVYNQMRDDGAAATLRTYNTLLKAMRAHGDFDKGFQLYEEMKKKGCVPDIVTYNTLLWLCEDRLHYVLGTGAYSHLLRSQEQKTTGRAAVANLSLTLLAEMQSVDVQPNTFSYNKILSVLLQCEDARIFSVYRKAQRACILPETKTVPAAASRSSVFGSSSASRSSQKSPPRQQVSGGRRGTQSPPRTTNGVGTPMTSVMFQRQNGDMSPRSAKVSVTTADGVQKSLAEAMAEEDPLTEGCIRAIGVRANIEMEKLMMRALLFFEQPHRCKEVHLSNRQAYENFRITRELALILMDACARTNDRDWAESLMEEVLALQLLIDVDLFNTYLTVLAKVADPAVAEHFQLMKLGIHPRGVCANTRTFNIVMGGFLQQQRYDEGLAVFAEMCDPYASRVGELTPDDETLTIVIQLHDGRGNAKGAGEAVERAMSKGLSVGTRVFHELLRLYARHGDPALESWFTRLKERTSTDRLPPLDAECYAIVMGYYLSRSKPENIAVLFSELKTSQTLEPTPSVYRVLFDMYKAQGHRKAMAAVFDDARMNSIKLDVTMYNTVLEPFVEAEDPFVFDVLSAMREDRIPPSDTTMALFLASATGRKQLAKIVSDKLFYKPNAGPLL